MKNASMNTCIQVSVWTYFSFLLVICLEGELLGHVISLCLIFRGNAGLFSKVAARSSVKRTLHDLNSIGKVPSGQAGHPGCLEFIARPKAAAPQSLPWFGKSLV